MNHIPRLRSTISRLCAASLASLMAIAPAAAAEKSVKVYILSGQSNMVGIGQMTGGYYHGNAETFMLVGETMGKAMVELQQM